LFWYTAYAARKGLVNEGDKGFMGRYLDPKSDVVFKKIFCQHPHLLISFLNALLPLPEDSQIIHLEYLTPEQTPSIPILKRTIVDVKCRDQQGRIFIVEMQIEWSDTFMQRLLFGTAQAYVKQLSSGEGYHLLNPVYGLGIINSIFDKNSPDWYHHYSMVKVKDPTEQLIKGLSLVFIELPKFVPQTYPEKKLTVLWLRFMNELTNHTREVDPELLEVAEIKEAVSLTEEAAYSLAELDAYEGYWKAVRSESSLLYTARAEGEAKGLAKGRAEGKVEGKVETARLMKAKGIPLEIISECTGFSIDEITRVAFD
jgi:predicted transposase/invertase (TIGR01784 family)